MNDLTLIQHEGIFVVDSREVAEMIDKEHRHLLRDIGNYCEILNQSTSPNLGALNFFIPSTYQDAKNEERPCYLLTRKGCDMVANKMTGEKGILFTAAYVTKFEDMEHALIHPKPMSELEILHQMTGALLEQDRQLKAISGTVDAIQTNMQDMREVIALDPTGWREDCARIVSKIAKKAGGVEHIKDVWSEVHRLVDTRMGAHLSIRITNIQKRLALEGASKTKIKSINALDAISENKRLIEGTCHIIKMLAVKNGVGVS